MGAGSMKNAALTSSAVGVLFIIIVMVGAGCISAQPQILPSGALFVFGDSLYDAGNVAYTSKDAASNYLPYGETYFKKGAGRFSDGRVVPDWIAQFAGLPFAPAYLTPNLTDYTKGVNFAYAGAPVLVDDRVGTINMKLQVDHLVVVIGKLKSQIGEMETRRLMERAVFLFSVGGVDYIDFCSTYISTPYTEAALSQLITMVIGNITSHIQTIYKQGGRRFAFQSTGPIGCMPGMRLAYVSAGHPAQACIPEGQYVSKQHNLRFSASLRNLQFKLPGFKYSFFDYFTQATNRVLFDNIYGFTDNKDACCGTDTYNGNNNCASQSSAYNLCSDPNQYLWFDSGHPTDRANGQYSRLFWSGPPDVVGPLTLRDLFTMPPGPGPHSDI